MFQARIKSQVIFISLSKYFCYYLVKKKSIIRCFDYQMWKLSEGKISFKETLGGSPGLVAMGGDSCSEGCRFESQHSILDGRFHIDLL